MMPLAWRLLPLWLKGRALPLLFGSLLLATASVIAINLFVERIAATLDNEAAQFIAADARIDSSKPLSEDWMNEAQQLGLRQAQYQSFRAMVFAGSEMQLVQVKATSGGYPLYGTLELGLDDGLTAETMEHGPAPGKVWLAPRLFTALSIKAGSTVKIGAAEFIAEYALLKEPDAAQAAFGFAPRAMIHLDDVSRTEAVQTGSRVDYALLVAGSDDAMRRYRDTVGERLGEHARWVSPEEGSAAFNATQQRARRFLLLAGSLSVILCGVAIALSAQRFALHQQQRVALLKTFGLTPTRIHNLYLVLLVAIGLAGCIAGSALGWLLHWGLIFALNEFLPADLAAASSQAYAIGWATTVLSLFAFAGPPILALRQLAPAHILRQEPHFFHATRGSALLAIAACAVIVFGYSRDLQLGATVLGALLMCIAASAIAGFGLLALTRRLQSRLFGVWRIGLANLQRHRAFTSLQIFVFACVGMLVLVLGQLRTSLIEEWQPAVDGAPNHFVFNIFDDEKAAVQTQLQEAGIDASAFYPMSRGRLIAVNEEEVRQRIPAGEQRTDYQRELNLTYSQRLGEDNAIIEGAWWQGDEAELAVSAEQAYAEGLGLHIGDTLRFSIAGREFDAVLASIRSVEWDSMNPNFYMIFNQPIADRFAMNWITSFYLDPERATVINELTRSFPGLSIIELDDTLTLLKRVVTQVTLAVEFILMLVLAASVFVLLTSILATLDDRVREAALLRSFGAHQRTVRRIAMVEFASIGLLAGLFACLGAEAGLYFLMTSLFEMPWHVHTAMWLTAPPLATLGITALGVSATQASSRIAPMQVLRLQ